MPFARDSLAVRRIAGKVAPPFCSPKLGGLPVISFWLTCKGQGINGKPFGALTKKWAKRVFQKQQWKRTEETRFTDVPSCCETQMPERTCRFDQSVQFPPPPRTRVVQAGHDLGHRQVFLVRTTPQPWQNLVEPRWNPGKTRVEPWWNPGGTLVEPYFRAAPDHPIWDETPKLSAVGGKWCSFQRTHSH